MKTNELKDAALDWAVAKCLGITQMEWSDNAGGYDSFSPTTDWAQGGPIIEREGISMACKPKDARGLWHAVLGPNRFLSPAHEGFGPTPLVAAMRCFVASKMGDNIEIPEELK